VRRRKFCAILLSLTSLAVTQAAPALSQGKVPPLGRGAGKYDAKAASEAFKAARLASQSGQKDLAIEKYCRVVDIVKQAGKDNPFALQMAKTVSLALKTMEQGFFYERNYAGQEKASRARLNLLEWMEGQGGKEYESERKALANTLRLQGKVAEADQMLK
jgi:hypothetical protein